MEEGKDRSTVQKEVTDKYSLRGRVFHRIREDILSGKYSENEELKEAAIGAECGVSRTPVREALRQLELEGLVELIPNKGAIILGISPEDICDIYQIRSMLEGCAAERAALRASDEQIRKLAEIVDLTDFYIARQNMQQLQALDGRFHGLIYEMTGSRMMQRVLRDMHYYVGLTRDASLKSEGRAVQSVEEHRAVLEAITRRDGERARALMTRHVENARHNVLERHLQDV